MEKSKGITLKEAKRQASQASRKFQERKIYINRTRSGLYKTSLNKTKESEYCYRNGSEILP